MFIIYTESFNLIYYFCLNVSHNLYYFLEDYSFLMLQTWQENFSAT